MKKSELIGTVAQQTDLTKKQTEAVLSSIQVAIGTAIKQDGRFALPEFGVFTLKQRKARTGRNPRTGKAIKIKASKTVTFKPALSLKKGL